MTNADYIVVGWISHYPVYLMLYWWRLPLRPTLPPPRPIPSTHSAQCLLFHRRPESDSRLMAGGPTGHVADTVLPPHGSTVCHLHLQAWRIKRKSVGVALRMWRFRNGCSCSDACSLTNMLYFHWFDLALFSSRRAHLPSLPLISLVNLTRCESVSGRGCSSMLWMSSTSHMNWMTGWAL